VTRIKQEKRQIDRGEKPSFSTPNKTRPNGETVEGLWCTLSRNSRNYLGLLELYGIIWDYVDLYGIMWNYMGSCGIIWNYLEFVIIWNRDSTEIMKDSIRIMRYSMMRKYL
jgi:hypothetical protein